MVDDLRRLGTAPRSPGVSSGRAAARPVPAAMIEDLRWLRQRVLERLDALEALARRRPAPAVEAGEIAARERTLQQREAELDEARRQLRQEAERQSKEWSEALAQLDADRRRLAEAWERVEQQRIAGLGASEGHLPSPGHGHGPPRGTAAAPAHTASLGPTSSTQIDPEPNNPVAREILRQFETLGRDVRSNAGARRDPS
jgi:exonuclease VII large subunit